MAVSTSSAAHRQPPSEQQSSAGPSLGSLSSAAPSAALLLAHILLDHVQEHRSDCWPICFVLFRESSVIKIFFLLGLTDQEKVRSD